jgi:hypothetical protein
MDEVIKFVLQVFSEMYQLEVLNFTAFDEAEVQKFADEINLKYFYSTIHGTGIMPQYLRTPETFARPSYSPSKVKAPILFQAKEYDDVKWGKVYKVYASSTQILNQRYSWVHYVAKHEGQWKIIGQDAVRQGFFEHFRGVNFDHLETPLEVRKFQPPSDPADLEEYNSE